ncbi:MAG: hypothetical protein HQL69_01740 [Magnetococcales bacterium]|nr:hypothetical protein [Magnetococcales bacterium]
MNIHRFMMFVGLFSFLLVGQAQAGKPEVPSQLDGVQVVGSDAVMGAMESGSATLVDARKPADFENGTIPGSISCQVSSGKADVGAGEVSNTVNKFNGCGDLQGADKGSAIVIYCNGDHCWRSAKGALALKNMGFSKVQWYRMGMNDWKAKGLPME